MEPRRPTGLSPTMPTLRLLTVMESISLINELLGENDRRRAQSEVYLQERLGQRGQISGVGQ